MPRWTALAVIVTAVLAQGGCAYVEFQHPQSLQTARCGSVPITQWLGYERATEVVYEEIGCIDAHQGQGFERAAPRWTWL